MASSGFGQRRETFLLYDLRDVLTLHGSSLRERQILPGSRTFPKLLPANRVQVLERIFAAIALAHPRLSPV